MNETDFIEDDIKSISITSKSFRSLWVLSSFFRKKKIDRMKKSTVLDKTEQIEKSPELLERFKIIEV